MTRYRAVHRHWRRHPRPEWLIAAYLGYKPPAEISPLAGFRQRAQAMQGAQAAGRGGMTVQPPTGELLSLFERLGGQPGKTVVLAA
ncbi:MAG TPA: hypothetical protein VMU08_04865 [Rhizomicrobium sp.]|nr:hypothetical protein [Rhizomicrobium sp.]